MSIPERAATAALHVVFALLLTTAYAAAQECHQVDHAPGRGAQTLYDLQEYHPADCGADANEIRTAPPTDVAGWRRIREEYYGSDDGACHWFKVCVRFDRRDTVYLETGVLHGSEIYVFRDGALEAELSMGNALPLAERASALVWSRTYSNTAKMAFAPGRYDIVYRTQNPHGPSLFATFARKSLTIHGAAAMEADARRHQVISAFVLGWMVLLVIYQLMLYSLSGHPLTKWFLYFSVSQTLYLCYEDGIAVALLPGLVFDEILLILTAVLTPYLFFRFMRALLLELGARPRIDTMLRWFGYEKLALGCVWMGLYCASLASVGAAANALGYVGIWYRAVLLLQILATIPVFVMTYRDYDTAAVKAITASVLALAICVFLFFSKSFLALFAGVAAVGAYLSLISPIHQYLTEIGASLMSLGFGLAVVLLVRRRERVRERTFGEELLQVEMSALRAQMNPHFLFNGLNSIKLFVIRNEPKAASDYLTKFSRLIRLILENSKRALVPLSLDLQALRIYVELESLRFTKRFEYEFRIGAEVDTDYVMIPPMLVQPYVENAIWHGLLHKEDGVGRLSISIRATPANRLVIAIRDNGVGRSAALHAKSRSATLKKSLGMDISSERLKKLGEAYDFTAEVTVTDLTSDGQAVGTEVIISLTYLTDHPQAKNAPGPGSRTQTLTT